ncbi:Alpha/Beta hydrolase protein [Mycena olivaceomarginata]|nr:Alpha/Beta hydrolase protein [Mycena olivaceomarginata]
MSLRAAATVALVCAGFSLQVVSGAPDINTTTAFAPVGTLNILSECSFTALKHPEFPGYGVRIKKSNFCDEGVGDTDDVIFWTNCGPECSSGIGLLMELDPCRVVNATKGTPIGVGFSYADYGEYVSTTEEVAPDIAAFVSIFFAHFSKFQGRGFHMSGESYAGRYIPVFAAAVYDQNPRLIKAGIPPINLTSVMIGNGMTDEATTFPAWYEIQCTLVSLPPVQNIKSCVEMKAKIPRCTKWVKESCVDQFGLINCGAAEAFCGNAFMSPYIATGLNYYDLSKKCEAGDLCYAEIEYRGRIIHHLRIRTLLGVDVSKSESAPSLTSLLDRDVRAWTRTLAKLEWSGQAEFGEQPLAEWVVDGKRAGRKRYTKGLTFATVGPHGTQILFEAPRIWQSEDE